MAHILTEPEDAKLRSWLKQRELNYFRLLSTNPRLNLLRHKLLECSWWSRECGMLVDIPGHDPRERLR